MHLDSERLKEIRIETGISKAEAARRLNMTAMAYGRYESGERQPSYQTVSFIADKFNVSVDYLLDLSEEKECDSITIKKDENPELFELVLEIQKCDPEERNRRLKKYAELLGTLGTGNSAHKSE